MRLSQASDEKQVTAVDPVSIHDRAHSPIIFTSTRLARIAVSTKAIRMGFITKPKKRDYKPEAAATA